MGGIATTSLRAIGITTNLVLAGFSMCSSYLAIPCLYEIDTASSTQYFKDFYHNGAMVVLPLTILSTAVAASTAYNDSDNAIPWVMAGALTCFPLAWTRTYMMPTNMTIINLSNSDSQRGLAGPAEIRKLLMKWASTNAVRTLSYFAAGVVGLCVLLVETHGQNHYLSDSFKVA